MKYLIAMLALTTSLAAFAQNKDARYFEMRTYHCFENKRPDLIKRFTDHTTKLFEKHGIENIAYFVPDTNKNILTYIIAYPSKSVRDSLWNSFATDPEWLEVKKKSEENGKIIERIESVFLNPLDFSPIK
ncbi:MAG: NIPSNAP family protein [Chitinophagaceae bacterium]|nr:NIPSNAP family protein [Chitinophagaceae bacterium]